MGDFSEIRISEVALDDSVVRILNRINEYCQKYDASPIETLQDIEDFDTEILKLFPGVGNVFVEKFESIKSNIKEISENHTKRRSEEDACRTFFSKSANASLILCRDKCAPEQNKVIEKLIRYGILDGEEIFGKTILDLEISNNQEGFGQTSIQSLHKLQADIRSAISNSKWHDYLQERPKIWSENICAIEAIKQCKIKATRLTNQQQRSINKLIKCSLLPGQGFTVYDFLSIRLDANNPFGIGKTTIESIIQLQKHIASGLSRNENLEILDYGNANEKYEDPADVERIIISEFEEYLGELNDSTVSIICSMLGYNCKVETLREVGESQSLSSERVRQLFNRERPKFAERLSINESEIENLVISNKLQLLELFPNILSYFETKWAFYGFFDFIFNKRGNFFVDKYTANPPAHFLNDYFKINRSPSTYAAIFEELVTQYDFSDLQANFLIRGYISNGDLLPNADGNLVPKRLSMQSATANILLGFPKGLPWKEIYRLIIEKKISKSEININDEMHRGLVYNDYVVLCGRGEYKHYAFLNYSHQQKDVLFSVINKHFSTTDVRSATLLQIYNAFSAELFPMDYYTCRYIISNFSEDFGYFFMGNSQADTISIDANTKLISQKNIVKNLFIDATEPLSQYDISQHLKTKSEQLANLYISELMSEGIITQVNAGKYCSVDKVASNDIIQKILKSARALLSDGKISEIEYIKHSLNVSESACYSKFFYSSILKQHGGFEIHHVRNFYSFNEIPYGSLREAFLAYQPRYLDFLTTIQAMKNDFNLLQKTIDILLWRMKGEFKYDGHEQSQLIAQNMVSNEIP